ncbi:MAG: hypothetical protein LBQ91_06915 [Oscillospiraceae bacterium]|nr:hypothetical protein [Oscillospiraceae bacterium]
MSSSVTAQPFAFSDIMAAGLVKLPGIWLLAELCVLMTGLPPKQTPLLRGYFGLPFFVVCLGRMMDLPPVSVKATAFGALPDYPLRRLVPPRLLPSRLRQL